MMQRAGLRIVVNQGCCLFRKSLVERLEQEEWVAFCAVASELGQAREWIEQHKPHVLAINISPRYNMGISSLKILKRDYFWLSILAFSCDSEFENAYMGSVIRAGADGYIDADNSLEDFVRAIRLVWEEKPFIGNLSCLNQNYLTVEEKMLKKLSRQEAKVFCLTGCGYVPKRIAALMNLSVKTVESYRERIRDKMDLPSGADLLYTATNFMRNAAQRGLVGSDEQVVKELLSVTG
jgi:DNA-binding NarL/FixJ family response regulator